MPNTLSDLTLDGPLTMGGNDIAMTGNLADTGARVAHGWFTDLTVTNPITADITGSAATVDTNADLTGPITSTGNVTAIASQTGTGTTFVVDDSPTISTPNIAVINAPTSDGVAIKGRTSGNAYAAGYVGEVLSSPMPASGDLISSTATITIGSPAVVTYADHGLETGAGVNFTTTGSLPTGLLARKNYYVIKIDANSFWLAASVPNALDGIKIATSGSQSGTHTCHVHIVLASNVYADANGLRLTPGVWAVTGAVSATGVSPATLTGVSGQITLVSGTTTPIGNTGFFFLGSVAISGGAGVQGATGVRILNVSSTTDVFGIVRSIFSSGGAKGCCSLTAVRIA